MSDGGGLRTGWEPDRPPGDTVLGDYVASWAGWLEGIARACGHRWRHDDDVLLHDAGSMSLFANSGLVLQPITGGVDDFIARVKGFYADASGGQYALFSPWPTPDFATSGFDLAGHPPMMLRPPGGDAPATPSGLRIEEVSDDAGRLAFDRALVEGFPISDVGEGELVEPGWLDVPGWRMWVGFVDDEPVATAGGVVDDRLQHVEWVSTRPEFRRRGYGEALTWRATLADPSKPALLIASDDGRPVYAAMGYLPVTRFTLWIGNRE